MFFFFTFTHHTLLLFTATTPVPYIPPNARFRYRRYYAGNDMYGADTIQSALANAKAVHDALGAVSVFFLLLIFFSSSEHVCV